MADFNTADPDRLPYFRPPTQNTAEPQTPAPSFGGSGVTDHGALTGLGDDDHTQYHTNARGDARYEPIGTVATHEAASNPHPTYLTQAEGDAAYSALGHNHSGTYEPALGNPASDGYVLQSTAAGVRSWAAPGAGSGDVTGPAASVDSELALYSGTGGKTLKRATTTGLLKATSGVLAAAVAGTDYPRPYVAVATLASNQATGANTTPVTLTGLSWSFEANSVYVFRWVGQVSPAAATTGCGFQLDVSAAVTEIAMTFFHQLANTGTLSGGHSNADDASAGVSSGLPGTGTYPVSGQGLLRTGANTGTAQLRFRSETTAVITAKAGLTLVVERVA